MLYACVRAVIALALRLFYRLEVRGAGAVPEGPVILVGNHPNGLVDPALVFVVTARQVTFLAKAPLFALPVLGWLLKALGALPVFRRQDDPSRMEGNAGTLEAASRALVAGGAITLFPEGKSHDAPHLAELKTGAARIALRALREGAPGVRVVPVGLTYAHKHRFRSAVRVEVGAPLAVQDFLPAREQEEPEAVRRLTAAMGEALAAVTLNLETWEDLPLVETAEQLWALRQGTTPGDGERQRRFARGVGLFRQEDPARFEALKGALLDFRQRLALVQAGPADLALVYRPAAVARFVLRHVLGLAVGLPLCALGLVLFALPYQVPLLAARAARASWDLEATVKLLTTLVVAPLWWGLLTALAGWQWGLPGAVAAFLGVPPLALLTRAFLERGADVWRDVQLFLRLGSRQRLKEALLAEGEQLAAEVEAAAAAYAPRTSLSSR